MDKVVSKVYLGIDPGKKGALAALWVDDSGVVVDADVFSYDVEHYLWAIAQAGRDTVSAVCCLERVSAMPGQGVKSMFTFGENYGWIQGLLAAKCIPYQTVPPQKWKKEFSLGKDKKASIAVCKRLFPDVRLRPTERCKVDSDGMAEALLMAEYARRHM